MNSVTDVWKCVLDMLGEKLSPVAIMTWFGDCEPVELTNDRLVVYSPSEYRTETIEKRFIQYVRDALRELFMSDIEVTFIGDRELERYRSREKKAVPMIDSSEYTFDNFIVGNSNKFAHAAALAVAEGQTRTYNPLFIYGNSGLGKTHLLYAIRHTVMQKHPEYAIVYVKGDDFTNELIRAIQTGKNLEFREKYRRADLFLMDDIQFIAGKAGTEEEFFHTFNALYEDNKQVVFTSDRPPNEMTLLTDRLRSRFESGLIADIQTPDYETRAAIVRNKSAQLGLRLTDDVVDFIAKRITANVRQLEGAVKKLHAYRDMEDTDITVSIAEEALKVFREGGDEQPTPDAIIEATAKFYNLTPEDLKGQRKTRNTAMARQVSMYIIRTQTNLSLNDIGQFYSGRDHTTVLASLKKIEKEMAESKELSITVKDIISMLSSKS
ncbi:MAG: chromosomal replication initiator protein DnaA [Oscillospiraceae bacterium]|nr:chromosomal replication initiator protein DnaA [Oscillospiraceae bacterium]